MAHIRNQLDHRPVPRLELHGVGYDLFIEGDSMSRWLTPEEYAALCEIAGDKLPVYENAGTWTQLPSKAGYMGDQLEGLGIAIWRYTRP